MEVIFVDNGLTDKGEHSYSLIKLVGERLTVCGVRYRAFGMKSIDPTIVAEIGALPHFSRSLYQSESPTSNERRLLGLFALARGRAFDATIPSERTSARVLNAAYEQDLAALPPDKCDKGFHLLPRAIEICRAHGLDANFTIQLQHSGWEPATVAAERTLRQIPGVRLVEMLSHEEYTVETGKIDAMLLPYDPVLFGLRGSGIFTQSVAAGRLVIASAGTFAGASIASGKAEREVFSPQDSTATVKNKPCAGS
jgi:hypothetical protein